MTRDTLGSHDYFDSSIHFVAVFGIGFLISLILAAGEEIGWRDYMLTRLIDARVPQPVLVSGLIWGGMASPVDPQRSVRDRAQSTALCPVLYGSDHVRNLTTIRCSPITI